jgi:hypothetical protein
MKILPRHGCISINGQFNYFSNGKQFCGKTQDGNANTTITDDHHLIVLDEICSVM